MWCPARASWYASIFFLQFLFAPSGYASEKEAVVLECMAGNLPGTSSVQGIEFRSENRFQTDESDDEIRILRASIYGKRGDDDRLRILAYFHEPFDIRGARILLLENEPQNDAFLYVPALPGVRRLKASHISSSVNGTDFSYEDLQQLYGMAKGSSITRQPDTELNGRTVYVLATMADTASGSAYERIVAFMDKQTCVTMKMELYGKGDRLRKVFSVLPESVRQVQGLWIPHEMQMQDLRNKTETTLIVHSIEIDSPLPDEMFENSRLGEFQPR